MCRSVRWVVLQPRRQRRVSCIDCKCIPGASPGTQWQLCHLWGTLPSQRPSRIYVTSMVAHIDEITVNEGTSPQEGATVNIVLSGRQSNSPVGSDISQAGGTTIGNTPQPSILDNRSAKPKPLPQLVDQHVSQRFPTVLTSLTFLLQML